MDIETFTKCVKQYSFLYDITDLNYKDTDKKNSTWNEIADKMRLQSGSIAKSKWRNLRDSYIKHLRCQAAADKPNNSSKSNYKRWPHADKMEFLQPYINLHKKIFAKKHEDDDYNDDDDNRNDYGDENSMANNEEEFIKTEEDDTQYNTTTVIPEIQYHSSIKQKRCSTPTTDSLEPITKKLRKDSLDDTDLFFLGLAGILKKLPKHKQAVLKLQCSKVILQAEIEFEEMMSNKN